MFKLLSANIIIFFFIKCSVLDEIDERIIGGQPCTGFDHHFAVVLRTRNNRTMCTGSLLSAYWVLTAAHCCHLILGFVMAGISTNNVSGPLDHNTKVVAVEECIMHKDYDPFNIFNDVAVLRLAEPINEGPTVSYVRLPRKKLKGELSWYCRRGMSMGWGLMEKNAKDAASILQCTYEEVLYADECLEAYKKASNDPDTIVCIFTKGTSTYSGDSGGPFMCNGAQYGITSFGAGCRPTDAPSVSTRVDTYLGFIKNKTGVGNSASEAIADIFIVLVHTACYLFI